MACHRIEGPQTFEKLAELMCDVHARFKLEGKITRTVTDNGSNFCKLFRHFGPRSGLAATDHLPPVEDMDDVEEVLPSQPQPQYQNEREDGAPGDHGMMLMTRFTYPPVVIIMCMWQRFWKMALRRADFTSSRNICAVLRIP